MIKGVTEKQVIAKAIENYDQVGRFFDLDGFKRDFSKVQFLCKFLKQYKAKDKLEEINIRLILNYFIIIYNTFDSFATEALFYFADELIYPELIAFLVFIDRLPLNGKIKVCGIADVDLDTYHVSLLINERLSKEL